ncbi:Sna2p KNAG_0F00150 [Huiozyma naganishii CBS 8797]|uniref:Plasma membrane proteolipid 3 n=1 Tax=Huiozyma naganishii (strain ATCC MYA-139 / BCRC 22969 / CBS 8797 / KCTC 17520 / NBRC 10181 / NCYC 3082 / Yp74L-3) TaxID=1071383 RepID=J7RZM7_HUIN7|nr:hypothetical protein KNAG_0F00150 [Kazachstania naganishii CBS 8797]CCK70687.1 hypothetical protein KNAG_0F00150 [Kazachstania naganishii CBS 8797]
MHARDWFLVFIAVFVPPVAVWFKRGLGSKDFWINLLLFLLGFFPGLIHALYIISCHPYSEEGRIRVPDTEAGNAGDANEGYGTMA